VRLAIFLLIKGLFWLGITCYFFFATQNQRLPGAAGAGVQAQDPPIMPDAIAICQGDTLNH